MKIIIQDMETYPEEIELEIHCVKYETETNTFWFAYDGGHLHSKFTFKPGKN